MSTQNPEVTSFDELLASVEQRFLRTAKQHREEFDAFLSTRPPLRACRSHPEVTRQLDPELSRRSSFGQDKRAVYTPCPKCEAEAMLSKVNDALRSGGVPKELMHATLDNWKPRNETEAEHLERVRQFTTVRRGTLIMLGDVGTGKTHLAVGVARLFAKPVMVKQSALLRKLRATYRDRTAEDPVPICQNAGLLVLDEIGLSVGGRDELPMLHDILDHRHCEMLPTVLTGNLHPGELRELIGERLDDRLHESGFEVLNFTGPSQRAAARERYFS
jgi:DNA replication protein DnaC